MFVAIEGGEANERNREIGINRKKIAIALWNITYEMNVFNKTDYINE